MQDMRTLRRKVGERMQLYLQKNFGTTTLAYKLLSDYPTRPGKGIRPAFCLAAAAAVGGDYRNAVNTGAAIELLHNAFLIKDDVVDQSLYRRGDLTLNRKYGLALAANAGDALKILSMSPLIDNLEVIGVRKSLQVILEVQNMANRSVAGQITELTYVKNNKTDLKAQDYFDLCENKTCWYTTITPCRTGVIIGSDNATNEQLETVTRFALKLGLAFQITDDTLNLSASEKLYGKEINGDIMEGKRTLILIHLLNSCTPEEMKRMRQILKKPRDSKSDSEVEYVRALMQKYSSFENARRVATELAEEARKILVNECDWMTEKRWKNFFLDQTNYLIYRKK
ncbi:MAG TPA: polyprenyl synthetase family protein [Nitrososphaerales archaeon]|nr:polyprenyl synthetase family protein [Nitrososphaerales archaeon]